MDKKDEKKDEKKDKRSARLLIVTEKPLSSVYRIHQTTFVPYKFGDTIGTTKRIPGCSFRVFRQRTTENVMACSLWINPNSRYGQTLVDGLIWWTTHFPNVYGSKWNVRVYLDGLTRLRQRIPGSESVRWVDFIQFMLRAKHMEVWMYECGYGHLQEKWRATEQNPYHNDTFGSLLRLHALNDPEVRVAAIRNVEGLTCREDYEWVTQWLSEDKQTKATTPQFLGTLGGGDQHWRAQQYIKSIRQKTKLGFVPKAGVPWRGLCLCAFNAVKPLQQAVFDWSLIETTWSKAWGIVQQKGAYAYGVDEFVLRLALEKHLVRDPSCMTTYFFVEHLSHMVPAVEIRQLVSTDQMMAWFDQLAHRDHIVLSTAEHTEIAQKLEAENWFRITTDTNRPLSIWLDSYSFVSAWWAFLKQSIDGEPQTQNEQLYVDQLNRDTQDGHFQMLIGIGHNHWWFSDTKTIELPFIKAADFGIDEKRETALLLWHKLVWDRRPLALFLPGWSWKYKEKKDKIENGFTLMQEFNRATSHPFQQP